MAHVTTLMDEVFLRDICHGPESAACGMRDALLGSNLRRRTVEKLRGLPLAAATLA